MMKVAVTVAVLALGLAACQKTTNNVMAANETAVENNAEYDVNASADAALNAASNDINAAGNAVENAGNAVSNAATNQ
jgi:hypothetical protein